LRALCHEAVSLAEEADKIRGFTASANIVPDVTVKISSFHERSISWLRKNCVQETLRNRYNQGSIILIMRFPPHRSVGRNNIDVSMHRPAAVIAPAASASELRRRTDMDGEQHVLEARQMERTFRIPSQLERNSLGCQVLPKDWQYFAWHQILSIFGSEKGNVNLRAARIACLSIPVENRS
jgi:hypothetical protein